MIFRYRSSQTFCLSSGLSQKARQEQSPEHGGEILRRAPAHHDARILPVPERMRLVDVFVREVDAARKGGHAVDEGDLSVRAVVLRQVEHGAEGVETHTFHALFFQLGGVVVRHFQHGADVVVDDAHVHAFARLSFQDVEDGIPEFSGAEDKIFEEDIFLRLFQLFEQAFAVALSRREILKFIAVRGRQPRCLRDVFRAARGKTVAGILRADVPVLLYIETFHARKFFRQLFEAAPRTRTPAQVQVEQRADGREEEHGHQPRDLVLGVHVRIDDPQRDREVEYDHRRAQHGEDPGRVHAEEKPVEHGGDDGDLYQE